MQALRGAWGACQRPEPPLRCQARAWPFSIAMTWMPGFVSPLSPSPLLRRPLLRRPLSPISVSPIWFAGRAAWSTADHRWCPLASQAGLCPLECARIRVDGLGWAWMHRHTHAGRYIYSSCSRIILLGYSPISILKTPPNRRFGGFFGLQKPSAAF
jgi:hypothetical protein